MDCNFSRRAEVVGASARHCGQILRTNRWASTPSSEWQIRLSGTSGTWPGSSALRYIGGRLVTIVDYRNKDAFFIVEPNQKQLIELGKLLDAGKIKTFLGPVVPLAEASSAYDGAIAKTGKHGKMVVAITR